MSEDQAPKEPLNPLSELLCIVKGEVDKNDLLASGGQAQTEVRGNKQTKKQKWTLYGDCSFNTTILPTTNCAQSEFWTLE